MPTYPIVDEISNVDVFKDEDDLSDDRELFVDTQRCVSVKVYATEEKAIDIFKKFPADILPLLPSGHQWISPKKGKVPSVIRASGAKKHEFELKLFGPEKKKDKVNYIFSVDGMPTQHFAHTQTSKSKIKGNSTLRNDYPMTNKDYKVLDFDYGNKGFQSHIRGHGIDLADTLQAGKKKLWSTYDPDNYVPEPHYKYWGLTMRNFIVKEQRKTGNGYMQYAYYGEEFYSTANETSVPEFIYLSTVDIDFDKSIKSRYSIDKTYHIDWETNYSDLKKPKQKVLDFCEDFVTSSESAPVVKLYDVSDSDKTVRLSIRNMRKLVTGIEDETIKALHPRRDALFAQINCANQEFESLRDKLKLAMRASVTDSPKLAKESLKRATNYGLKLLDLDDKREIISDKQMKRITKILKAEGINDPDDTERDKLRKIRSDQGP